MFLGLAKFEASNVPGGGVVFSEEDVQVAAQFNKGQEKEFNVFLVPRVARALPGNRFIRRNSLAFFVGPCILNFFPRSSFLLGSHNRTNIQQTITPPHTGRNVTMSDTTSPGSMGSGPDQTFSCTVCFLCVLIT
jgi:hypothetical protein